MRTKAALITAGIFAGLGLFLGAVALAPCWVLGGTILGFSVWYVYDSILMEIKGEGLNG